MSAIDDHRAEVEAALRALHASGLWRTLRVPSGVDLVSNDYLGLARHPAVREAMGKALAEGPVGSGGSRLLRGHHGDFDRLEERLAAFSGAEAALFFGSGYLANVGLFPALAGEGDVVLSDEANHASLIDGIRLSRARRVVVPHGDLAAVERALAEPRSGWAFVVTESVFSMDGDLSPLAELQELCERHRGLLVVDEAHATGLYGERGSGRVEALGLRGRVLATMHTGGKALGCGGAWVAGSKALRDLLVNRARTFIYSTAPLPALAAGLLAALDVVREEPLRRHEVHRKAALLRAELRAQGVAAPGEAAIVPVVAGSNEAALRLEDGLRAEGFDVRAVRPPTVPAGTARLRVTVQSPTPDEDLTRFARAAGRLIGQRAA
jgi:8-amino-7-oxononanoate synthase